MTLLYFSISQSAITENLSDGQSLNPSVVATQKAIFFLSLPAGFNNWVAVCISTLDEGRKLGGINFISESFVYKHIKC